MHKAIMILSEAKNKEEALLKTREFLEEYGDGRVWDWFAVGGRWSNTLAPKDKTKLFIEKAKEILNKKDGEFLSNKDIEEKRIPLQAEWEKLGLKGNNPYADHYSLSEDGDAYDVVPLKDCLDIVKEWQQTLDDAKFAEKEAAKRWLNQTGNDGKKYDDWNMYGYQLKIAANLYHQDFCFDTNVYNIESWNYFIPNDIENYYVVMIDIHN